MIAVQKPSLPRSSPLPVLDQLVEEREEEEENENTPTAHSTERRHQDSHSHCQTKKWKFHHHHNKEYSGLIPASSPSSPSSNGSVWTLRRGSQLAVILCTILSFRMPTAFWAAWHDESTTIMTTTTTTNRAAALLVDVTTNQNNKHNNNNNHNNNHSEQHDHNGFPPIPRRELVLPKESTATALYNSHVSFSPGTAQPANATEPVLANDAIINRTIVHSNNHSNHNHTVSNKHNHTISNKHNHTVLVLTPPAAEAAGHSVPVHQATNATSASHTLVEATLPPPPVPTSCLSSLHTTASWRTATTTRLGNARRELFAAASFPTTTTTTVPSNDDDDDDDIRRQQDLLQTMILDLPQVLSRGHHWDNDLISSLSSSSSALGQLLGQSICHEQSPFRKVDFVNDTKQVAENNPTTADRVTIRSIRQWTIRLVYLAMMYHQNRFAWDEAKLRHEQLTSPLSAAHCVNELASHNIGPFDFECPAAKYIVVSLAGIGLGANVRGGTIRALLAGLASNRVVLFVNNAPEGAQKHLRKPWLLASCPRMDYQCFFLPPSPCVLTQADLVSSAAYRLTQRESNQLLQTGQLPPGHAQQDNKVWHMQLTMNPVHEVPRKPALVLQTYAKMLVSQMEASHQEASGVNGSTPFSSHLSLLKRAVDRIAPGALTPENDDDAKRPPVLTALVVFSLRPNAIYAQQMKDILKDIVPSNFQPEQSFGLPVRASDKCLKESECLSFEKHMQAVKALVAKHPDLWPSPNSATSRRRLAPSSDSWPTIIFTSESSEMVREQEAFAAALHNPNSSIAAKYGSYRIVSNTRDVTQDTGQVKNNQNSNITADDAMLSALSSMQFQLLARVSVGNCCSNFHVLLADLLAAGCGAASTNKFYCMQENDDPRLRICCRWGGTQCVEDRQRAIDDFLRRNATHR